MALAWTIRASPAYPKPAHPKEWRVLAIEPAP